MRRCRFFTMGVSSFGLVFGTAGIRWVSLPFSMPPARDRVPTSEVRSLTWDPATLDPRGFCPGILTVVCMSGISLPCTSSM
uniref:Putative secreted protein n=1 Tax=Ixodes ricinus TaxID=34613 RepID=A0A6B0U7V6_IXORI